MTKDQVKIFRAVLRKFEREIFLQNNSSCCEGVTVSQCHALLEIELNDNITITELAKSLALDKSTVSRTVESLVSSGLVIRTIPSGNRRTAVLTLSDAGKTACNTINTANNRFVSDSLEVLTKAEQSNLITLFEKITHRMADLRNQKNKSSCKNN